MNHKCSKCDFSSSWISNTRRHFRNIHNKNINNNNKNIQNTIQNSQNDIQNSQNTIHDSQNAIQNSQNTIHNNLLPLQCIKCNKILSNKHNLNRHINICKGIINKLECQICHVIYSTSGNLSKHRKICKAKEDKQLIVASESSEVVPSSLVTNIQTQNNHCNNNYNTTNNIIVFASKTGEIEFIKTPEFDAQLKNFLKGTNDTEHVDNLKKYNKELLSIKNNRCIKKTNIKSTISKVHIGNNKWETKNDEDIYPQMACNLADDMCNKIMQLKTRDRYKTLERILDCMADNGYVADTKENQKEMVDNFNNVVKDLKLIVYDLTKET